MGQSQSLPANIPPQRQYPAAMPAAPPPPPLGGPAAPLAMAPLRKAKRLSISGVPIAGAAAHNIGQVCAAMLTLGSSAPLYYLPFLLLVSLFTGAFSGLITACLFRAMAHTPYGAKGENHQG